MSNSFGLPLRIISKSRRASIGSGPKLHSRPGPPKGSSPTSESWTEPCAWCSTVDGGDGGYPLALRKGSKAIFAVEGQFVGGTGRYRGATGWLQVKSVNGFDEGGGELLLESQTRVESEAAFAPAKVRSWVKAYFEGTRSGDASTWAGAFAPNAVLDEPVGAPLKTTPREILEQGEAFLSAFQEIGLYEDFVHVVGNEAVAKWEGRGTTKEGAEVRFDGINVFLFDDQGKILKLRGFFAPP